MKRDQDLNEESYLAFNVLKEVQFIFGTTWKKHVISMSRVEPSNLWEVELIFEEDEGKGLKPEDIFLLENVD